MQTRLYDRFRESEGGTYTPGVANNMSEIFPDYGVLMAGSVMASVPVIVFFVLVQRYIISGLTSGAVKG